MSKTNYLVRRRRKEFLLRQLKKNLTFAYMYGKSGEEVERDLLKTFPDANEKLKGAFERYKQKLAELKLINHNNDIHSNPNDRSNSRS